jgi:uncharacterized protein YggU (UPF0235/DUF167 family)
MEVEKIFVPLANKSFNFAIKVKADGKSDSLDGAIYIDGTWHLKLTIKAVPENGKTNKAIIDFFSHRWSVPKKSIRIVKGMFRSHKILNIHVLPNLPQCDTFFT